MITSTSPIVLTSPSWPNHFIAEVSALSVQQVLGSQMVYDFITHDCSAEKIQWNELLAQERVLSIDFLQNHHSPRANQPHSPSSTAEAQPSSRDQYSYT